MTIVQAKDGSISSSLSVSHLARSHLDLSAEEFKDGFPCITRSHCYLCLLCVVVVENISISFEHTCDCHFESLVTRIGIECFFGKPTS